jgi:hypothetical protein
MALRATKGPEDALAADVVESMTQVRLQRSGVPKAGKQG